MSDQAERLRQLVGARLGDVGAVAEAAARTAAGDARCEGVGSFEAGSRLGTKSLVFTSGKGGVGTSNLVLNLGIALAELGQDVLVIDADMGLANLDLLCGLTPRHDLGDVLAGRCGLSDAIVDGPAGVKIVAGAHAVRVRGDVLAGGTARLIEGLREVEPGADFLLVDAGSGLRSCLKMLASAADEAVVVTTPEPTALADAHATIGRLRRWSSSSVLRVVVNQATSRAEGLEVLEGLAGSSRQFLGAAVAPLGTGWVRFDPHVRAAVRHQRPFLGLFPGAPASRNLRRMAGAMVRERYPEARPSGPPGLLAGIAARWGLGVACPG